MEQNENTLSVLKIAPGQHPQQVEIDNDLKALQQAVGGSTVSAPRTMIQSVATEYGIANLSGKTLRERAESMIAIAHPDFRDELEQYAKEAFH